MAVASTFSRFLPSVESSRNLVREAWDRLHRYPGGTRAFSRVIGWLAPYTGSIAAHVVELGRDRCRVVLEDRPRVRNHLDSVHAVALVNLAEVAGNLALAYSLPDDGRFIVAGLTIDYLKKARGTITATCTFDAPRTSERREYEVPVVLTDAHGTVVARASLRTLVGPKPDPKRERTDVGMAAPLD